MTGTCDDCGDDVTAKTKGTFLDWCAACLDDYGVAPAHKPSAHDCAECGDPAVGRPDGTWLCGACWNRRRE